MKRGFIQQFFSENINGIEKSSMNRLIAFLIGLAVVSISVLAIVGIIQGKIHKDDLPNICLLLGTIISPLLMLLGFSAYTKAVDIKNPVANPNLPPPTQG